MRIADGQALAKAIPGAIYEEFAATSHGVTILNALLINARLARFFRSVEVGSA